MISGYKWSPEKLKNHKGMLGIHHSEESKKKISENGARIWLGKKLPKETVEKIRQDNLKNPRRYWLGKKRDKETCRKIGESGKGRKQSDEQKKKTSERMKGNIYGVGRTGEKHPNWIVDRSKLKKSEDRRTTAYFEWCKDVYKRDNWKCRIANEDCNGRIEAHHILSWRGNPKLRYEVNNGITLCHAHHPHWKNEAELTPSFQDMVAKMKDYAISQCDCTR